MSGSLREGVTLYFVRHGQTDWNVEGRLQGQSDTPLNENGRSQAARNGEKLRLHLGSAAADLDFIASPLIRTRQTMQIMRGTMGLNPESYRMDDGLKEISFGDWEANTLAEVALFDAAGLAAREADKWGCVPPNGESYEMLYQRIGGWLSGLERDAVVVSHGGVMRVMRLHFEPLRPEDAPHLEAPQDKVLVLSQGAGRWL